MSNRHAYEEQTIEVLLAHLNEVRGIAFKIVGEHVRVGPKNCDYLLGAEDGSGAQIAVELVRIVDERDAMQKMSFRGVLWDALKNELTKLGLSGVWVRTPWNITTPPRETKKNVAPELARRIFDEVQANPAQTTWSVDGYEVRRIDGLEGVVPSSMGQPQWINNEGLAETLLTTLEDKDAQLELTGVQRVLVAVALDTNLDADDIVRELARRPDLHRLKNADRVFFVDRGGHLHLVYAREVRDFFTAGGAFPDGHPDLVDRWFWARLESNHDGTYELVRKAHEQRAGLGFLGTRAREALAHHGGHLVKAGRHSDALWIVRTLRPDEHPGTNERPSSGLITTVRGTTAWLLHQLAAVVPVDQVGTMAELAREFSTDCNIYVREMAAPALRVLMGRRDASRDGTFLLDDQIRRDIKALWLDYVRRAPSSNLQDAAANTLAFIYDIEEPDVHLVVDCLRDGLGTEGLRGVARFLIYFAEFRPTDPGLPKTFIGDSVRERFHRLLREDAALRAESSFIVFRSMKDHPVTRRTLAHLVPVLLAEAWETRTSHFGFECVAMLAEHGLLTAEVDEAAARAVAGASKLEPQYRMMATYELRQLAEALIGAGQRERLVRWLNGVTDPDLLREVHEHIATLDAKVGGVGD